MSIFSRLLGRSNADPPSELPIKAEDGTSEAGFMYFKDTPIVGEAQPGDPFAVKIEQVLPSDAGDGSVPSGGLSLNFEKMPLTYPAYDEAATGNDRVADGGVTTGETPPAGYGDAGEQTYLAVKLENVQGGAPGTNEIAMQDTPDAGDPSDAAVPGRIEMPNLSFHVPEAPADGDGTGEPTAGFKISDNEGATVADSFGFGVEREMKESGEKGGTEDINIGVGELQAADQGGAEAGYEEAFVADSFGFGVEREMKESGEKGGTEDINIGVGELQESIISKDMDAASGDADGVSATGDAEGYRPIQILKDIDKTTPGVAEDEDNEPTTLEALEVQSPEAVAPAIAMADHDHADADDLDLDLGDEGDIEV